MLSLHEAKETPENRSEFLSDLLKQNRGLIHSMLQRRLGPSYYELMADDVAHQAFLIGANRAIDRTYGVEMEKFNPVTFIVNKGLFEIRNELKQIYRDRNRPLSNVYVLDLDDAFESEMPTLDNVDREVIADLQVQEFKQQLSGRERQVVELMLLGYTPPQKNRWPGDKPQRCEYYVKLIAEKLHISESTVLRTIASLRNKLANRQLTLGV